MAASQFSRSASPTEEPHSWFLKETGDLENEARLIILGWQDADNPATIHYKIDKSTFGGVGTRFVYERDHSGTLRAFSVTGDY